jgi:hypothetical protein
METPFFQQRRSPRGCAAREDIGSLWMSAILPSLTYPLSALKNYGYGNPPNKIKLLVFASMVKACEAISATIRNVFLDINFSHDRRE